MKIKRYLFILSMCTSFSFGQSLTNQKSFGGSGDDNLNFFNAYDNTGYYLFGNSNSNISGNKTENSKGLEDYWLVKIDNDFNILWDKTYGGSASDVGTDVLSINDGLILSGLSYSNTSGNKTSDSFGGTDIWVLSLDETGDILWQQNYGGDGNDGRGHLLDFTDTSFLIVSISDSGISGNKTVPSPEGRDIWLLEVGKSAGAIIQQKIITHGASNAIGFVKRNPYNNHIYISADAAFGISGDKSELGYGSADAWLIELDETLSMVREKVFGGSKMELEFSTIHFDEAHIYVACSSQSGESGNKTSPSYTTTDVMSFFDAWLIKLDYDWSIIWDKTFGGNRDDYSSRLVRISNDRLGLSTSYNSMPNTGNVTMVNFGGLTYDMGLLILNNDGDLYYQNSYGGTDEDHGILTIGNNNTIILSSSSNSPISGNKTVNGWGGNDLWLGKMDLQEILALESVTSNNFTVFPNPASNQLNVVSETEISSYEIMDINGKVVLNSPKDNTKSTLNIDISMLQSGIYFLKVNDVTVKFSKF